MKLYIEYHDFFRGGTLLRFLYGCDIPRQTKIAKNVICPHHALGVVISPYSVIDENVVIQHHVTIAMNAKGEAPHICRNAYIGAHAFIMGGVEIGENAVIGAGTIVLENVEPNGVYVNKKELVRLHDR